MIQVIRRPGGGWVKNPDGSKGQKLWHNVRGRRTLTQFGRENLEHGWYDVTIHVPALEHEMENPHHAHNDMQRPTWYPVSEASLPGLTAVLGAHMVGVTPEHAGYVLPQAVKDWILARLTREKAHQLII